MSVLCLDGRLEEVHELPDVADARGDRVARGEEVLRHGLLLILEQLGAGNADELDGDAARLRSFDRLAERLAVREPDQTWEDTRFAEYPEARMRGQVGQDPKLGHQSGVDLKVKAASHRSGGSLRDFSLPRHDDIARKALEQLMLAGLNVFLPSRAWGGRGRYWVRHACHEMPPTMIGLMRHSDPHRIPQGMPPRRRLRPQNLLNNSRFIDGLQPVFAIAIIYTQIIICYHVRQSPDRGEVGEEPGGVLNTWPA